MFNKSKTKVLNLVKEMAYNNAINIAASQCNAESFADIKNCNIGKKIALCGAGPSLNKYKPITDCMHVALNRALLKNEISYDWFVADDWIGIKFFQDQLISFSGIKFFGHLLGDNSREIPESFRIRCKARRYYSDSYIFLNGFDSRFVCDIDKMAIGQMPNIALSAMQILLFSNPDVIYLVGCDANTGHFYQPKELSDKDLTTDFLAVSADHTIEKWKELKEFASTHYPDTKIISINPVGLKGLFIDEYQ